MARIPESSLWEEEIELISRSERVSGGLDGVANRPLKALANRTRYLKGKVDKAGELVAEKVSAVKTFAEGATLESPREEILYGAYRLVWTGEFPKTVLAGSTPQGTGGVGAGRWAYTSDAVIRKDLGSSEPGMGAGISNTTLDISVQKYIDNSSPRISDYKVKKSADATEAFAKAFSKSLETTGVVIVDVSCVLTTAVVPEGVTVRICDYVTVTHPDNAPASMFILSSGSVIKGNNKKGRLRGNSANQSSIRRCISAVGVTGAGVDGVDIRDFNSYGAYFENCEDTFCRRSTIRDITGGAVETAAGQYITNCINHESERNDIRDTGSNGIKFRADSGGLTRACSSSHDKVYRAGFIGIAHSKVQDHTTSYAYCENCVDNGLDMNGCQNCTFSNCTSVGCQDG
ncbi:TPA: right-handed parallel beta-helix repeat-containing protein, partial [Klebsiella pneumoniae]|nr:right-handed parallel beta-helix repeat-containing protein [Klebsiella pneumoniae]